MGALADADGPEFAAALVERACRAGADAAQAGHESAERFELDADSSGVNLVATHRDDTAVLTVFRDGRRGSAALTGRDEAVLEAAIRTALDSADAARPDPANGVVTAESEPAAPSRYGPDQPDREAMIEALEDFLGEVRSRFPPIRIRHADYSFEDRYRSFVNSAGVRRQERRALHRFWSMFSAKEGSRSTSFNSTGGSAFEPFGRLMEVGGIEPLIVDTMRSFHPRPTPGKLVGDIIITPSCAAYMATVLAGALDGYALMGDLTPYAGREGERIASPAFSLLSRPADPWIPEGSDFDGDGVPTRNVAAIRDGVLETFLIDLFCSRKLGRPQNSGHAALVIPPGEDSPEALIGGTERGILLARFSGGAPNRKLDFSGIAKNSFYVESGEIRYPLIETMVSGNFRDLLMDIRGISRESIDFGGGAFPYLAASGITISPP